MKFGDLDETKRISMVLTQKRRSESDKDRSLAYTVTSHGIWSWIWFDWPWIRAIYIVKWNQVGLKQNQCRMSLTFLWNRYGGSGLVDEVGISTVCSKYISKAVGLGQEQVKSKVIIIMMILLLLLLLLLLLSILIWTNQSTTGLFFINN